MEYGMKDFLHGMEESYQYVIWKNHLPFHSIQCPTSETVFCPGIDSKNDLKHILKRLFRAEKANLSKIKTEAAATLHKNKKIAILALTLTLNLTQTPTLALTLMLILTQT